MSRQSPPRVIELPLFASRVVGDQSPQNVGPSGARFVGEFFERLEHARRQSELDDFG